MNEVISVTLGTYFKEYVSVNSLIEDYGFKNLAFLSTYA